MRLTKGLILALVLALFLCAHASAGTKYLSGSPDLRASIAGTNEFYPGDTATLSVVVENKGLNDVKIIGSDIVSRDDLPNTAKLVGVELSAGASPVTVKTDGQMIGDLAGGASKTVSFTVTFAEDAAPGVYSLPLEVNYTYLYFGEQTGTDSISYTYKMVDETLPLEVRISPDLSIEVSAISTDSVNVGTEGYLTLHVKNIGHETGRQSVVAISRNSASPVIPTDGEVYVGEFAPGEEKTCVFKVSVSTNAEAQTYPLDVNVKYLDENGAAAVSKTETIGVPVGGKIDFEVISSPAILTSGGKGVIEVVYKNAGAAKVYNAQARISAVDPFSSNDDTAYLGDLAPGETATARYEMSVDSGATIKTYGLDSEIRYRDSLDNSQISGTMKVEVVTEESAGMGALLGNPVILTVLLFGIIGGGYYLYSRRNQK